MDQSTKEKQKQELDMVMECYFMQTIAITRVNGDMVKWRVRELCIKIQEKFYIQENGNKIGIRGKGLCITKTQKISIDHTTIKIYKIWMRFGINMKESSIKILKKDLVQYI